MNWPGSTSISSFEAAGREAVGIWGEAALAHAPAFAVASTSAFCDDAPARPIDCRRREPGQPAPDPARRARRHRRHRRRFLAGRSTRSSTASSSRRPPGAGRRPEKLVELDDLTEATTFFSGTAREAASRFPQNANVAVISALAGIGLDRTRVELVADPAAGGNGHQLSARAPSASSTSPSRPPAGHEPEILGDDGVGACQADREPRAHAGALTFLVIPGAGSENRKPRLGAAPLGGFRICAAVRLVRNDKKVARTIHNHNNLNLSDLAVWITE